MSNAPYTLVLLRHGESEWNAKNLFTGWVDVDLNDKGRGEAQRGGELLKESGILPDIVHTSLLRRAINTSHIALNACDRHWIPVVRNWRLNERHYGALQGKNKRETLEQYGEEQFMLWRRSYDVPPPPIAPDDEWAQTYDPRYAALPPEAVRRRNASPTSCTGSCPIGRTSSSPSTCAPVRPSSSPPTGTPCAPW